MKRFLALILCICLVAALFPAAMPVEAEAVSGVNSLTCAGFISNPIPQKYIDTMMKYYINNNTSLQSTLNNGLSVVFMFEGGSDNYWNGSTYYNGVGDVRNQAVCIVVKKNSSGNAYIAYYCENCSTVPDNPKNCTGAAYSGATTVMDGIHSFYTWNHTGPYGAFQLNVGQGYYTPLASPNGYTNGASGLNIHTRSTNTCNGVDWSWSLGCQVIGSGYGTGNEFNQFMKVVAGLSYNVWVSYPNTLNTLSPTGVTKGYYVLDRQLGKMDINGTQFGSGSLIALYNSTALNNITAKSTSARNAAGFSLDYKDQCTKYPSYCNLTVIEEDSELRAQPCSSGTDAGSTLIETVGKGTKLVGTGIYQNQYGNYWYEVKSSSGKQAFIYGGNVQYEGDIISDVTLTDATPPNGHVQGTAFYVNGTVKTSYNKLSSVACNIYDGLGTGGTLLDSASDTPSTNTYSLKGSAVDNATNMSLPQLGINTYIITASYLNYYATAATTLKSNSGTLTLMEAYYMVVPSAVDQNTCTHTNTTYVMEESSCISDGFSLIACTTCGKITEQVTSGGHAYSEWVTTLQPTCDKVGIQQRICDNCGDVQTQEIAASGHTYSGKNYDATCQEYARIEYTCVICNHSYSVYADELMSQWSEIMPEGIDPALMESKTQYRYSDYETLKSDLPTMEGYTQISKDWVSAGKGSVLYVSGWPAGYLTSHSLYATYNNKQVVSSETATEKIEAGTMAWLVGYVYYHWCRGTYTGGPINRTTSKTQDSTHTTFHSFYASKDTMDPTTLTPADDGSIVYANGDCCKDSHWYYYIPVYEQNYSKYTVSYTYERWTAFTDWSDTEVTASDIRKVESRVLYRYADAQLGDHVWIDGNCDLCGENCQHSYKDGFCIICGAAKPVKDFYLFGFINGESYGCDQDYANIGVYKFVDGKLTVKFEQDSFVAVKTGDNDHWYVTDGWQGYETDSAVLYESTTIDTDDYLYVPGGCNAELTLVDNEDGTFTLQVSASETDITLKPAYPTLSMEGEIIMNIYFMLDDLKGLTLADLGMITFDTEVADGDISDATDHIPGAEFDGTYYIVGTHGIPAKKLGDTIYFKLYAQMRDGSYVYSELYSYSPKLYAQRQLDRGSVQMKTLAVAMLNYGAAAQKLFDYNAQNLINADLTAEQKALVKAYSSDMVSPVASADSSKVGAFANSGGFSDKYPRISFDGAFSINYYFTALMPVEDQITMYYWDMNAYNSNLKLSAENATGRIAMTPTGEPGQYTAAVEGIVARQIDEAVYVAAVYESNGVSYCTGVLAYSLGKYCKSMAGNPSAETNELAAATAVYGYYAKAYFASI